MDWLPGFAWPLPRAFTTAVSSCRFEQGDVLYERAEGYGAWPSQALPSGWVQVLDPPRSARSAPADAEGNRFEANWRSPVTLELAEQGDASPRTLHCSQGGLFTCLWRGDRGALHPFEEVAAAQHTEHGQHGQHGKSLPLPGIARELQKHLEAAAPALLSAAKHGKRSGVMFVAVVDESSEASLAKARSIESALAARSTLEIVDLAPAEAGVPGGDDFHPTLRLRAAILDQQAEAVAERLKAALYAPTARDGSADRFRLERHGLLLDLAKPSAKGAA
jgi:hypothetical protein